LDDYKTKSYEETFLPSKLDKSFNNPIQQTSLPKLILPPSPELQFQWIYQIKEKNSVEQNTIEKNLLENTKETSGINTQQKIIIQYPLNTDKVIDHYNQINQSFMQMFFNTIKLQKDYLNTFQPRWVEYMRTKVENYLVFQNKMIFLYIKNYNLYLKNVFDSIIKEQERNDYEREKDNIFLRC